MKQLTDTENTIAGARDNYNKVATNYNKNVQSFPKDIFAGMFGFQKQSLFKADAGASQAPKVDFSTPATQPQNQTQPQSAQ
jgi:LemA protein